VYSVIVSFGVTVSLCFSVFIAKGIFGVYATLRQHNKMIKLKPNKRPLFFPFSDIHNIRYFVCLGVATFWPRGTRTMALKWIFCDLRVLARKLVSPFGHPTRISTQVQLVAICDYSSPFDHGFTLLVLSTLPAFIHNSIDISTLSMNQFFNI